MTSETWKSYLLPQPKSTSNSSASGSRFHFERPFNILWKSKRNASNENLHDLTETCIFKEKSSLIGPDSQTESLNSSINTLAKENFNLVQEVKNLRTEVNELKAIVMELLLTKQHSQMKNGQVTTIEKENDLKKIQKPPLPCHRSTRSHNF
jgi:Zn-dependent M32 family carboxypeptidase